MTTQPARDEAASARDTDGASALNTSMAISHCWARRLRRRAGDMAEVVGFAQAQCLCMAPWPAGMAAGVPRARTSA